MNYYFFEDSTGWRSTTVYTSLKLAVTRAKELLEENTWRGVPQMFIYKVSEDGIELTETIDNEYEED